MNRLPAAFAPGLFAVFLLAVCSPGQAQTVASANLALSVTDTTAAINFPVSINGVVTPEETNGTFPYTTGVEAVIVYNPNILTLSATPTTLPASNPFPAAFISTPVTFTVSGNNYSGYDYTAGENLSSPTTLTTPTTFVTYNFTINAGTQVGTQTTIYYSDAPGNPAGLTDTQLTNATNVTGVSVGVLLESYVTTTPPPNDMTTYTGGILTLTIGSAVPAPSALALFAAGATSALTLLRCRRRPSSK